MSFFAKRIMGFFGKVIVIYALLMIPWPGVMAAYRYVFCACGNMVFRTFGSTGRVYFAPMTPAPAGKDAKDTTVTLENIKTRGARGTMEMNSRLTGYLPAAFAVALILATPLPRSRRGWSLLWGLLFMGAFTGLEVMLQLLNAFSDKNVLAVFSFGPIAKATVIILLKVVALSPVTAYIAPVFVWILVTFRRMDWTNLLTSASSSPAEKS